MLLEKPMNLLRSPKNKLLLACAALTALGVLAALNGISVTGVSRAVLGALALGTLGWWILRAQQRGPETKFQLAPRMLVVTRAGLSQRTGLALVEVDGRSFLVVHGDGYAEICPTAQPAPVPIPVAPRPLRATDSYPKLAIRRSGNR